MLLSSLMILWLVDYFLFLSTVSTYLPVRSGLPVRRTEWGCPLSWRASETTEQTTNFLAWIEIATPRNHFWRRSWCDPNQRTLNYDVPMHCIRCYLLLCHERTSSHLIQPGSIRILYCLFCIVIYQSHPHAGAISGHRHTMSLIPSTTEGIVNTKRNTYDTKTTHRLNRAYGKEQNTMNKHKMRT